MKTLLSLLALATVTSFASAQKMKESEVPASVVEALHKNYPDVKNYIWYNEDGNYEAEYKIGKMEAAIVFDPNGSVVETEKQIQIKELPATVTDAVSKNYSGAKIEEATVITDAKGAKSYEAEIKGKALVYDQQGNLMKEEQEKGENEEDKDKD